MSRYAAQRSRRNQTADMVWGGVSAVGLPLVVFLILTAADVTGSRKRSYEQGAFRTETERPPPPMSLALGREYLNELKRLYEENYRNVFLPRLQRDDLTAQERIREFRCADQVIAYCDSVLLKTLEEELRKKDSEIKNLSADIRRWREIIDQAKKELDGLNPFPESMRGGRGGGAVQ